MEVKLLVVNGQANKRAVSLNVPAVLGRSRKAGLTVAHPMVSRQHCELYVQDGLLMIRDLGSTNGTLVTDRRVQLAPLLPDSEFMIGPFKFRAEYEYDGDVDDVPATVFLDEKAEDEPIEEAVVFDDDEGVFDFDDPDGKGADQADTVPQSKVVAKSKSNKSSAPAKPSKTMVAEPPHADEDMFEMHMDAKSSAGGDAPQEEFDDFVEGLMFEDE